MLDRSKSMSYIWTQGSDWCAGLAGAFKRFLNYEGPDSLLLLLSTEGDIESDNTWLVVQLH